MGTFRKIWIFLTAFALQGGLASGVELDLRHIADRTAATADLNGLWEYSPSPILLGQAEGALSGSPQEFWMKTSELGESASYRLVLIREAEQESLLLVLSDLPSYRVSANGRLLLEKGRLPTDGKPAIAERGKRTVLLPQGDRIELILDVATPLPRWLSLPGKITVGPESSMRHKEKVESILLSIILGGLFIIGIYHICLFIFMPSRPVTLILALFCLIVIIRSAFSPEFESAYVFFPHFPYELSWKVQIIGYYLSPPLFLTFLMFSFPETVFRPLVRGIWIAAGLSSIMVLSFPASTYGPYNALFHIVTFVAIIAGTHSLFLALKRHIRGAVIMLIASLLLSMATLNDVARSENLPNLGAIIHYGLFIFVAMQSLILSSQFFQAFSQLAHMHREFRKIVYLHTVKLVAEGRNIEETMPTGTGDATVIAFDIVGSSKIKHSHAADAIERMMGRCYDAMSQGYDASRRQCRAYRVKEMGDGLICSIGFPFQTGSMETKGSVALKLAKEFANIFKEEMSKLNLPHEVYCAIGIAQGSVEGFFPRFGNKQYDLRGKSIVLATRYESMRNAVFQKTQTKGSLIFIQDQVYNDLSPSERAAFEFWDATRDGQRIRDDGQAKRAWYLFVPHVEAAEFSEEAQPVSAVS